MVQLTSSIPNKNFIKQDKYFFNFNIKKQF